MFEDLFSPPTPVRHQHVRGGQLRSRELGRIGMPIQKPVARDPSTSWSFFHPGRVDARVAPADFRSRVQAIDPQLDVVWHPVYERWCVWVRNPRITHWMCAGWQMLFPVRYADGSFMPLDDRTLALIFDRSPRKWGNARQYFDRIMEEVRRDYVAQEQRRQSIVGQDARDRWNFAQIKVAMCGPSSGSKFATHHSGN